jgi:hypothetical protein
MKRLALVAVIPLLVGPPLWLAFTWETAAIAVVTSLVLLAGVLGLWLPAITAGAVLALIELALALHLSAASLGVFGATAYGLALLFLIDAADFLRRFEGATIDSSAWRGQIAWWIGRAAIAVAATVGLVIVAGGTAGLLPSAGRPLLAGLGALIAFAATLRLVWPQQH